MSNSANQQDPTIAAALIELGNVKGQLTAIAAMIQQGCEATHHRIDDMRVAIDGRLLNIESRLGRVEGNERRSAINMATLGAGGGALVAAGIELVRNLWPGH